jgi:hypothetical protein
VKTPSATNWTKVSTDTLVQWIPLKTSGLIIVVSDNIGDKIGQDRECPASHKKIVADFKIPVRCEEETFELQDMKCAIPSCGLESLYFRSGSLHCVDCIDSIQNDAGPAKRKLIWLCRECTALWVVETWRPPGEQLRRRPLPTKIETGIDPALAMDLLSRTVHKRGQ